MSKGLDLAVVIPTYNGADAIPELFEDLSRQTLSADRFEVIVVDDCSTDDTADVVEKEGARMPFSVRLLRTPFNNGPAAARNIGWRATSAPLVAFTDDDCSPWPRWLEAGCATFSMNPSPGIVQGDTRIPEDAHVDQLLDWYVTRCVQGPTPWFEGCNLFFRRDVLEVTGGFDEDIRYYGEDCAAGWRVLEAGYGRGFAPEATITHALEHRGFRWYMKNGFQEYRIVHCASLHRGFRDDSFWRPWSVRREGAAFVAALVGLALARRTRLGLLLALPYLWWQRPSMRRRNFFRLCLQVPLVDAARLAGHLKGSLEHGIFVI